MKKIETILEWFCGILYDLEIADSKCFKKTKAGVIFINHYHPETNS